MMAEPWPERAPIFGLLNFGELTVVRDALSFHEHALMQRARVIIDAAIRDGLTSLPSEDPEMVSIYKQAADIQVLGHQADVEWFDRCEAELEDDEQVTP